MFHQTPIILHIISSFIEKPPKPFHAIPDIVLVVSDKEEEVGWLVDMAEKVVFIVEVKYDLGFRTVYERSDTTINQVRKYGELLRGVPRAVVVVYKRNPGAVRELRIGGVECIDGVNPDNSERVREFVEFVKKVVIEGIESRLRRK